MKKVLLLILLSCQLAGCTSVLYPYPQAAELFPDGQSLWQIRLGRGESQLFTGLLALDKKQDRLTAILLDSTGIKLLEESVRSSGEVEIITQLPAVRNKRLAPFLGKGLLRLFFNTPDSHNEPCRRNGLFELCFGVNDKGQLIKSSNMGPFVLWSSDYFINNDGSTPILTETRLNAGWFTPSLQLNRNSEEATP